MSRLGVYWAPGHGRRSDLDYIRALNPPVILILDPDVQQIIDAHRAAPTALIIPRDWALSEQKDDMRRDPDGTGERHAYERKRKFQEWESIAGARGQDFPLLHQLLWVGINEPPVWEMLDQTVRYTVAFLRTAQGLGMTCCALELSVGWPANTGPDTPPNWTPYEPVRQAIVDGRHYLGLHEYWYHTGPDAMWGWHAGRCLKCPWDVPMILTEFGVDNFVEKARWDSEGGNRGWRGHMAPQVYAHQIVNATRKMDGRVKAVMPFLTDYRAPEWASFDTQEAHAGLLQLAPETAVIVSPPGPGPTPPSPTPPVTAGDNWERAITWILKWEGGFQANPADKGNYYNGQLIGTKYGISAASWGGQYDIPNLTIEQAKEIYRKHYWQASGADKLAWPLCLLVMDTAILHGVGAATKWLKEAGPNPYKFAARRLRVYTGSDNWKNFGAGWVNRTADLLAEMG